MATGLLFNTAGKLLQVLGSLAIKEIGLACGVKEEFDKLKETISTIRAVLSDAEEEQNKKNQEVIVWLQKLKDAFYEADDLLDDFSTELKQREVMSGCTIAKEVRIFFSKSNHIAYSYMMARKIKNIGEKLKEIKNDRKFHLTEHRQEKRVGRTERETYSFVCEEKVIGRDHDRNEIKQYLLRDEDDVENVSVISIVGIGGIGKTTLAQSVYNDDDVKKRFELKMWVCVSNDFSMKVIVEQIIKSATCKEPENLGIDKLQEKLRQEINGKKYLLVLDDVWNENPNSWNDLKDLLKNGAKGSMILVTTRSEQVAKITSKDRRYHLQGLPKDKSWSLFKQIAFEQGEEPKSSSLIAIGKEILAKCAGVPLAIKTIGRLLYDNYAVDD